MVRSSVSKNWVGHGVRLSATWTTPASSGIEFDVRSHTGFSQRLTLRPVASLDGSLALRVS